MVELSFFSFANENATSSEDGQEMDQEEGSFLVADLGPGCGREPAKPRRCWLLCEWKTERSAKEGEAPAISTGVAVCEEGAEVEADESSPELAAAFMVAVRSR